MNLMHLVVPAAAFCGFLVQQIMMIIPAIKEDESTPDKFSLRYYFSRTRNRLMLMMNAAATLGAMLAHSELVGLIVRIPTIGPYMDGAVVPVITALLIGFGSAWVFRWIASKMA
jgi:hypothetical protein